MMKSSYDQLAPLYHLIFQDWSASIARQGEQLSALMQSEWPDQRAVLDVSCGIGTQAIALAERGYCVKASDISAMEIARAKREAAARQVVIDFSVCDMRRAHAHHGSGFQVVVSCDNSLPHLLTDRDLLLALREMFACLVEGGGCLISVRDYELEERGRDIVKPYGVRYEDGKRYLPFQVWDFEGDHYDLAIILVEEDIATQEVVTHVMRTRYYAVSTDRLIELMVTAGFRSVKHIDGAYYQPVLIGTKPLESPPFQASDLAPRNY